MPVLEYDEKKIEIDDDGCLVHFDDWDEKVAGMLAAREGIAGLTPESVAMLKFIRSHYKAYDFFPIVGSICRKLGEPKDCVREKFMNPLIAWKIAGLPHAGEPIISLLEAGQSPG